MDYHQSFQTLVTQYQRIDLHELEAENALVESYRVELQKLAVKYIHARSQKPRPLTIPEIFSRSFDENFISDYLAYILDPVKNGIGIAPLEVLLGLCNIDTAGIELDDVIIHREYYLENGRIDLLLEWHDNFVLGIENKILSPEGKNQTPYYASVIVEYFKNIPHSLVFLTRDGHKAQSEEFLPISYKMLFERFKEILIRDTWERRKLSLWEDFLEHLEVYIMNVNPDKFEFSEKAQLYIENCDMIDDLCTSFDRDWEKAISFLETHFLSHVRDDYWKTNFRPHNGFQQAFKSQWYSENINIHFEWWFDYSKFRQQKKISFMVDVEGKQADKAVALFDSLYKEIEKTYKQHGIAYPSKRKNAIAFKEYSNEKEISQVADVFIKSFDEFRFLEPIIDDVISKMKSK
jgi:hypothetical protein